MGNRRVARIAERIREEASQIILYELRDPRIQFVTVTKVDVSSDLRHAKVYASVLGDEAKRRAAFRGLASARGLVQARIAKSLALREAPIITFQFDPSIEKAIEISKLIDQAAADLPEHSGAGQPPAPVSSAVPPDPGDDEEEEAEEYQKEESGEAEAEADEGHEAKEPEEGEEAGLPDDDEDEEPEDEDDWDEIWEDDDDWGDEDEEKDEEDDEDRDKADE